MAQIMLFPVSIPVFSVILQHLPYRGGVLVADLGTCFSQLSVAEDTLFPFQAQTSGVLARFLLDFLQLHPAMWKVPSSLLEDEIHTVKSPPSHQVTLQHPVADCLTDQQQTTGIQITLVRTSRITQTPAQIADPQNHELRVLLFFKSLGFGMAYCIAKANLQLVTELLQSFHIS